MRPSTTLDVTRLVLECAVTSAARTVSKRIALWTISQVIAPELLTLCAVSSNGSGHKRFAWTLDGMGTLPDCRVLILTTFGRPGYLRRAMESGTSGFLVKDGPVDELVAAITPENVHAETDWGEAAGRESW